MNYSYKLIILFTKIVTKVSLIENLTLLDLFIVILMNDLDQSINQGTSNFGEIFFNQIAILSNFKRTDRSCFVIDYNK